MSSPASPAPLFSTPSGVLLDPTSLDGLTGALSRGGLERLLEQDWKTLTESGALALILVDLDAFKDVNDTYGHLAGDELLKRTVQMLREHFRSTDVVARFGGDEFVVVAPGATAEVASDLGDRARQALESQPLGKGKRPSLGGRGGPSFSLGVGSYPADGTTVAQLLAVADRRLYKDKRHRGRTGFVRVGRGLLSALAVAGVTVGLLAGSYLEARTETRVAQVQTNPPAPTSASAAELERLREEVARLQAQLVEVEAAGQASSAEAAELQRQLESLRTPPKRTVKPTPAPPPLVLAPAPVTAFQPVDPVSPFVPPEEEVVEDLSQTEPVPLKSVTPEYPGLARALRREATVVVKAHVDVDGRVTQAALVGEDPGLGFAEAALDATRRTTFTPGTQGGQPQALDTTLHFRFGLGR